MPNADYWKKRFLQLEAAQNQKGKNCCKEIEQQYQTSIRSIDKKINEWYGRIAVNNDVTMQEAYKLLDADELKEFKWDVNQYIKHGRENNVNGRWVKELENASAKYHISRLEAMKMDLRQELESLIAGQQKTIDKTMRNVYKDGYMHTAYEIQKGMHIGWDFSTIDKRKIDKVINNPWAADGKNFSERIWGNGTKLVGELNQILTQNIILGESPQKAIDKLSKRMDVSKRAAGRLVMTEQAFFSAASQREAFKELDVEEFEIVATLDSHTSNICRSMDGRHFPMSKWEVGVNAPPFHVYCRSTTVPYFDDEEELGIVGERAARNEDGEVYYVPGNMTYKEWEQAFVKGGAKDDMEQLSLPLEKSNHMRYTKRTKEQFEVVARNVRNEITQYSNRPSKWSGNIVEDNSLEQYGVLGRKEWSCDITLSNNVDDGIIWHEMLHSCSASYYAPNIYAENQAIEEASVEFLKQQICLEKEIENLGSYDNQVAILKIINERFNYGTDLEFAKELFNIPLSERYRWLENKVDESLRKLNISFEDYNDVMGFLQHLEGGINK